MPGRLGGGWHNRTPICRVAAPGGLPGMIILTSPLGGRLSPGPTISPLAAAADLPDHGGVAPWAGPPPRQDSRFLLLSHYYY